LQLAGWPMSSSQSPPLLAVIRPTSWDAARDLARRMPRGAFRGQPDAAQLPASSLERAAARLGYDRRGLHEVEERMLREARRRARQYLLHSPDDDDALGWLALLRHHGAPTRLLDFSKSFYVAVWFAIESADGDSAIWAVDIEQLRAAAVERLGERGLGAEELGGEGWELAGRVLGRHDLGPAVVDVEPFHLDERLAAQQGMFLVPLEPAVSFMDNLAATFGRSRFAVEEATRTDYPSRAAEQALAAPVAMIVLPRELHRSARDDLWRMNLTAASFFPGLDGFARSLIYFVGLQQPGEPWEK
jgi:hypothetical protein